MNVIFIDLNDVFTAIYTAFEAVVDWSVTHGVILFGWYVTFFELWCGVMVGGILISFIVYDDDGAMDVED